MGLFKNLRDGLQAARNPPGQAEIDAMVADLPPERRAAYEANMQRVRAAEAEALAAHDEAVRINDGARVLDGPAGDHLHGPALRDVDPTQIPDVGALMRQQLGGFTTALRQTFNVGGAEQVEDPVQRERVAAEERAERARARAPYRAPGAVPVEITRVATRGRTQLQDLLAFLGSSGFAAAPEKVFGVYRVPDRISQALTPHSEKGRVVEWDVVHVADAAGAAVAPPQLTLFAAADQWVGRRVGDRAVLDEDVALAFLRGAGIRPDRTLGIARVSEFRALRSGDDDSSPVATLVRGVAAVHADTAGDTFERMRAAAPLDLRPPDEEVVEVLDWSAIGSVVHPRVHHPPSVPSLFPYLPSTPQELLRAYLEVVGVRPTDCWAAQATVDRPRELVQGGVLTTNLGPRQPCADGKPRMRSHGCQLLVLAYRDRPEYAEGRERWIRYQSDVLQAKLALGEGKRRRIHADDATDGVPLGLRTIVRAAALIDAVTELDWGGEEVVPHRYCSPPVR